MMYVTATVSALLVFIFIKLSFQVIELRKMHKVAFGDGGIDALERAIRAHANFAEYVPMGLILMGALELNGAPWMLVAFVGGFLVLGRYFHAKGINEPPPEFRNRVRGMKITFAALGLSAVSNIAWVAYLLLSVS